MGHLYDSFLKFSKPYAADPTNAPSKVILFLTMLALISSPSAPKPFGSHPFTTANRRVELSLPFSSERSSENAAACIKRLRASHSATQLFTVFAVSRSR
jgi:hypothetical protein